MIEEITDKVDKATDHLQVTMNYCVGFNTATLSSAAVALTTASSDAAGRA